MYTYSKMHACRHIHLPWSGSSSLIPDVGTPAMPLKTKLQKLRSWLPTPVGVISLDSHKQMTSHVRDLILQTPRLLEASAKPTRLLSVTSLEHHPSRSCGTLQVPFTNLTRNLDGLVIAEYHEQIPRQRRAKSPGKALRSEVHS